MNRSESLVKIAPAIVAMQKALKPALKDSKNPFFNSKYADLGSVWEACYQALEANGLAVIQLAHPAEPGRLGLETIILHESGEWVSGIAEAPSSGSGKDGKIKDDPQTYGSATTYLRRYGLAAAIGVIAEDDDGNTATFGAKSPAGQTKQSPPPLKRPELELQMIPITAVTNVTQAKMLNGSVQYCIHAGESYYTLDIEMAKVGKEAAANGKFCTLNYVELPDGTRELRSIAINP